MKTILKFTILFTLQILLFGCGEDLPEENEINILYENVWIRYSHNDTLDIEGFTSYILQNEMEFRKNGTFEYTEYETVVDENMNAITITTITLGDWVYNASQRIIDFKTNDNVDGCVNLNDWKVIEMESTMFIVKIIYPEEREDILYEMFVPKTESEKK